MTYVTDSDYTVEQLVQNRMTLNGVGDLLRQGRVTIEVANGFFKIWCVGKTEHRWANDRPEVCYMNRYGEDNWSPMSWSTIRTPDTPYRGL